MKRINSYISDPQHEKLKQVAEAKGIGVGEVLRRVLDDWLEREAEKEIKADGLEKTDTEGSHA